MLPGPLTLGFRASLGRPPASCIVSFRARGFFFALIPTLEKQHWCWWFFVDSEWRVDLECALRLRRMPAGPFVFSVASVFRGLLESMEALTSRDCLGFTVL